MMQQKIVSNKENSSPLSLSFYDTLKFANEIPIISIIREKILEKSISLDESMHLAMCDGIIQTLSANAVSTYIFNKSTQLLKLIKIYGIVKNEDLSRLNTGLLEISNIINRDYSIAEYSPKINPTSYFFKERAIPPNKYKWFHEAISTLKPSNKPISKHLASNDKPFLIFPYQIDNNLILLSKITKTDFLRFDRLELQTFSLYVNAIMSQLRNRFILELIKFNNQIIDIVPKTIIPEKGLSVSLLGVSEALVMEKIKKLINLVDLFHIDVMDGTLNTPYQVFNIHGENVSLMDFPYLSKHLINHIKKSFAVKLDAHLMVADPLPYIIEYANAGVDVITISYSDNHKKLIEDISLIHSLGKLAGLAINPEISLPEIKAFLFDIDMILVMTVPPGKGGQPFDSTQLEKIQEIKTFIKINNLNVRIQVDGGINEQTGPQTIKAGANLLVSGSAMVKSLNPGLTAKQILDRS